MRIFENLEVYRPDSSAPLVLALGNFDGVHLGHQDLFRKAARRSQELNGQFAVFTFSEHPQSVLHPEKKQELITPLIQKLILLNEYRPDLCFLLPFTKEFSMTDADAFIEKILVKKLNVKHVFLGFNAGFGHDRKGDVTVMEKASKKFGFTFETVPPFKIDETLISSSQVREWIRQGDFKKAAEGLGRSYSILSEVIKGDGRGYELGFPTANLNVNGCVLPPAGVYAVKAREVAVKIKESEGRQELSQIETGPWHDAILNYGNRPTFGPGAPAFEVHLLSGSKDLYGKSLEVRFEAFLRGEKRFDGPASLKAQIEADITQAKAELRNKD